MTSITQNKLKKFIIPIIWIIIWQILASLINEEILLPSPLLVFNRFLQLLREKEFYISLFNSTSKILFGFVISIIGGILLAFFSYKINFFYELINPIIRILRSTPIASIVLFLLFWINKKYLSIYIGFIMAMPIIFQNIYTGLKSIDKKLLQMADIYQIGELKKIKYIYKVKIKPFLSSSLITISGLIFKAGVSAELIALTDKSIGKNLYNSKIYLDMPSLFAWTISIILIAIFVEKLLRHFLEAKDDWICKC